MAITDRVTDLVTPLVEAMDLSLYDVELHGGNLRVTVDGPDGVLLDQLAELTRSLSRLLDEHDPMPGKYTLEVSSPGLERRLRTPAHFEAAVGEKITVKLGPQVDADRRVRGVLTSIEDEAVVVTDEGGTLHTLSLVDITKAATVFDWGPSPKPGQPGSKAHKNQKGRQPLPSEESERSAAVQ